MPTPRRRTTQNKLTGTMGATRRAVNAARFGGDLEPDARRALVYRTDVQFAEERTERRAPMNRAERVRLAKQIEVLYCQQGKSLLDISVAVDRSDSQVRSIIAEFGFVKGKKQ